MVDFSLTFITGLVMNSKDKWLLPRAGERINKGIAASQCYCACSTLPESGVDSTNTLTK